MPNEFEEYLERARTDMFPLLKDSAVSLTILHGDPDPKLCLELGASILFEKPLIVLAVKGYPVPEALRRLAARVIEVDELNEASQVELRNAIEEVMHDHWPQTINRE